VLDHLLLGVVARPVAAAARLLAAVTVDVDDRGRELDVVEREAAAARSSPPDAIRPPPS
jgi:DNA-binding transcriptional regulator YbjK